VLLAGGGYGAVGDVGEARHAEVDGGAPPGEIIELGELVLGGGEADLQALSLAEPAFALGFADAGLEVVAQTGQPWPLGRVSPQQRAPDAAVLVDAAGAVGPPAVAERDLAAGEVAEELLPFLIGRQPVFPAGA